MNKKVFVLLPDGVGLRNFAFTRFHEIGKQEGFEIVYWNNTIFNLTEIGYEELRIKDAKLHVLSDIVKNSKIHITLNQFIKKTGDNVYDTYRFPFSTKNIKTKIKTFISKSLILFFNSEKGLTSLSERINKLERRTDYYQNCLQTLKKEKPDLVFCTNQRAATAIAPLLAAQDLNIPTATFIFSWDNLPKATMIVDCEYYFVWSDFMKKELLKYYPYISKNQVVVTGTTQFEPHLTPSLILPKEDFFEKYNLDIQKKYICYSGDDITTSPDDERYLEDVAIAIEKLNQRDHNLGIIFRRSPADFSNRYDSVLKKYSEIIVSIDPLWIQKGDSWNTVMPTAEDLALQVNIISNCELVINIASSMIFDFAVFSKPCLYVNYNVLNSKKPDWSSQTVYNFVHFRSMPTKESVIWLTNPDTVSDEIERALNGVPEIVESAKEWFKIINQHPAQDASKRIWDSINLITSN